MCFLLILQLLWLVGRLGSYKPCNHTSWIAVVTPTDRPFAIVVLSKFLVASLYCLLTFKIFDGIGAFIIGLSQISSMFS